jgi:hypothetical protein
MTRICYAAFAGLIVWSTARKHLLLSAWSAAVDTPNAVSALTYACPSRRTVIFFPLQRDKLDSGWDELKGRCIHIDNGCSQLYCRWSPLVTGVDQERAQAKGHLNMYHDLR